MQFFSTRDHNRVVSASQAIAQGLSDEGGLFVPQSFPQVDVKAICALDYPEMAAAIVGQYLTDYSQEFLQEAAKATYGAAFGGKAGYLAPVSDEVYSLELWHGPTCAFKDYALQLMPKLLVEAKKMLGRTETTRILVATSGDTGKAALAGYADLDGIEIEVFYPNDGTSEIQHLQMATQKGENVQVYAVQGNFDDAQTGVKKVFADADVAAELEKRGIRLSSANSINWGRLVPQIVYYFSAYADLLSSGKIEPGEAIDFTVPTGNFGDILAGFYAKCMGLPVHKLICASNANNVLTDFLRTGVYDRQRDFFKTISPSMDILISSNLERLLYHMTEDKAKVADWMQQLQQQGRYDVGSELLAKIQETFWADWTSDEDTEACIAEIYRNHHYVADPHTAVAWSVAEKYQQTTGDAHYMVVVSTASPYKFNGSVLDALGVKTQGVDEFTLLDELQQRNEDPIPEGLASLRKKAVRHDGVCAPATMEKAVMLFASADSVQE